MRIQINTHHTAGDDDFTDRVEAAVASGLDRFAAHITRVEVHLEDVNAGKGGPADKRCMIEARPTSHQPVAVTHQAPTIPLALDGALEKARKALDKALAARTDHKGLPSVKDNEIRCGRKRVQQSPLARQLRTVVLRRPRAVHPGRFFPVLLGSRARGPACMSAEVAKRARQAALPLQLQAAFTPGGGE